MADHTLHTRQTHTGDFGLDVTRQGDAKGIAEQFKSSQPSRINRTIQALNDASNFTGNELLPELVRIRRNLADAWSGSKSADEAIKVLDDLIADSGEISENTATSYTWMNWFQGAWEGYREYFAKDVDAGGWPYNNDDGQARQAYENFVGDQESTIHNMPGDVTYHSPLAGQVETPGPSPAGPAPAPAGPAPAPPPSNQPPSNPPPPSNLPPPPSNLPPSPSPSEIPSEPPPSNYPPSEPPPSNYPPSNHPPSPAPGPGTGLDTGSQLAGLGPAGGGLGPAGGVPGPAGAGMGPAGAGAGMGPAGAGIGPAGVGPAGVGPAGVGPGMMPMGGRGGQDEEKEQERSTWLEEDEDIWDGSDAPPDLT